MRRTNKWHQIQRFKEAREARLKRKPEDNPAVKAQSETKEREDKRKSDLLACMGRPSSCIDLSALPGYSADLILGRARGIVWSPGRRGWYLLDRHGRPLCMWVKMPRPGW